VAGQSAPSGAAGAIRHEEMSMKRKRPKTYEADFRGKKVRVTVPERHDDPAEAQAQRQHVQAGGHASVAYSGDAVEVLRDVLKDNLSPQAVAVIAGHLHGMVNTKSDAVNREVAWFTEQLLDMVGDQYNALCEEAGL
jgi:hypothetical protein